MLKEDESRVDIREFSSPREITRETRFDLHLCWNRKGTRVCIDSPYTGIRQIYLIDLEEVMNEITEKNVVKKS